MIKLRRTKKRRLRYVVLYLHFDSADFTKSKQTSPFWKPFENGRKIKPEREESIKSDSSFIRIDLQTFWTFISCSPHIVSSFWGWKLVRFRQDLEQELSSEVSKNRGLQIDQARVDAHGAPLPVPLDLLQLPDWEIRTRRAPASTPTRPTTSTTGQSFPIFKSLWK